jgi:hypothetical protein
MMKRLIMLIYLIALWIPSKSIAQTIELPVTGQITSYAANDDGALQKGVSWPFPRFTNNLDQSITDNLSGLIWAQDGNAPGPAVCNPGATKTWDVALNYVACLNSNSYLGKSDWRLPNRRELLSLINYEQVNNSLWLESFGFINVTSGEWVFTGVPLSYPYKFIAGGKYWSSNTFISSPSNAWFVDISGRSSSYGMLNFLNSGTGALDKTSTINVWPVRDEPLQVSINNSFYSSQDPNAEPSHLLTICNNSPTSQIINSIDLIGTNAAEFSIAIGGSKPCSSLAPTLTAVDCCNLQVYFAPTSAGIKTTDLRVVTSTKTLTIPLYRTAPSTIKGSVTDFNTGNKLANAMVTIAGLTTSTDVSGNFSLSAPPVYGIFDLTISESGYGSAIFKVQLGLGNTINIVAYLTPPGALNITTRGALPPAQTEIAYSQRIGITGGMGPFTFNVASGALPTGLTLDANLGTISGTPTTPGTYPFAIGVTDSQGAYAEWSYSIDVSTPLVITNAAVFPRLTLNSLYSFNINPSGGTPPYTITVDSGNIPLAPTDHHYEWITTNKLPFYSALNYCASRPGGHLVTITSDAERIAVAPYSYYDTTTSSSGDFVWIGLEKYIPGGGYKDYWRWVNGETSTYRWWNFWEPSGNGYPNCAGQAMDYTGAVTWYDLNCYNDHPFLCEYETIQFQSEDQFKGIVTPQGTSNFTIKVTDSAGRVVTKQFTMYVDAPLTQATSRLNDGVINTAYSQQLIANGGNGTYSWTLEYGVLPTGLTLNSTTGEISGTPTEACVRTLMFAAQDANGRVAYHSYSLTIVSPLQVLTTSLPQGHLGDAFSEKIRVSNGVAPYTFSIPAAQLPTGLALNSATGVITGTPTAAGLTNMQLTVTDSSYPTALTQTINLSLRISATNTITTAALLPSGIINSAMVPVPLVTLGGNPSYSWSVVAGALPQGVNLNPSSGVIYGTPTTVGDFTVTIRSTDSTSTPVAVDKQFFMHVSDTLQLQAGALPNGLTGTPYYQSLQASGGIYPYSWVGSPPTGLTIDVKSGIISGVPVSAGSSTFTVSCTDKDNPAQDVQNNYTIDILPDVVIGNKPNNPSNQKMGSISFSSTDSTATFECKLDTGTFAGCISSYVFTDLTDGSHTFTVRAKDSAGNVTASPPSFTWAIDTSAPDVAFGARPANPSNQKSGSIGFSSTDNTATFQCILDTGAFSACPSPYTYSNLLDGSHSITVRAKDPAGNVTIPPIAYNWTIDTMAPVITFGSKPANFSNQKSGNISFSSNDNTATFECKLDTGIFLQCTSPYAFTNLTDGSHTFTVRAKDLIGNVAETPFTWAIDTVAPDVAFAANPANISNLKSGSFNFISTDATATFECILDTGTFSACPSPYTYTNLLEGSHIINVRAKDPAGNVTVSPIVYNWTIDTIAPALNVNSLPTTTDMANVPIGGTTETGAIVGISINNGEAKAAQVTSTSWSFTATGFTSGLNNIRTTASDAAGNQTVVNSTITCNAPKLTVGIDGSGGGTVTSDPVGISCLSGQCTYLFDKDSTVKLMASPNGISTFGGWTGALNSILKTYNLPMNSDKIVTATFTAAPCARNATTSTPYSTLIAAISAANPGNAIWTLDIRMDGAVSINKGLSLIGGWNGEYNSKTGIPTLLNGALSILNGSSIIEMIDVKGVLMIQDGSLTVNGMTISATITDGICGSSNGQSFLSTPTNNLCSSGTPSQVSGTGPWSWSCNGINGGSNASCSALLQINGTCGSANGQYFFPFPPIDNLCSSGTPSPVSGDGSPWTWTCNGINGGSAAACFAYMGA